MKFIRKELEKLRLVKRKRYHPLIHLVHKKYGVSRKTLFYIKEYGPHQNVYKRIIKESIKILLFASIISSLGGFSLEYIKSIFISITPLIILLPTLNDMIGDYGMIISSRFSTMLHEGKAKHGWWRIKELRILIAQLFIIAIMTATISTIIALLASKFSTFQLKTQIIYKIFLVAILDTVTLLSILFIVSITLGIYFFKKKEDPNNFLIPITTSIADFGNMVILSLLVVLLF